VLEVIKLLLLALPVTSSGNVNPFAQPEKKGNGTHFSKETWNNILHGNARPCEYDDECPAGGICVEKKCLILKHHARKNPNPTLRKETIKRSCSATEPCPEGAECKSDGVSKSCFGIRRSMRPGYIAFKDPHLSARQTAAMASPPPNQGHDKMLVLLLLVVVAVMGTSKSNSKETKYIQLAPMGDLDDPESPDIEVGRKSLFRVSLNGAVPETISAVDADTDSEVGSPMPSPSKTAKVQAEADEPAPMPALDDILPAQSPSSSSMLGKMAAGMSMASLGMGKKKEEKKVGAAAHLYAGAWGAPPAKSTSATNNVPVTAEEAQLGSDEDELKTGEGASQAGEGQAAGGMLGNVGAMWTAGLNTVTGKKKEDAGVRAHIPATRHPPTNHPPPPPPSSSHPLSLHSHVVVYSRST
jgi:hypothetical protein